MNQEPAAKKKTPNKGLRFLMGFLTKFLIPVLILGAALGFTKHQMDTRPLAKRGRPEPQARLVTVTTAQQATADVTVEANGIVMAAQTVTVSPQVSGRIVAMAPDLIPGAVVQLGQELVRIDARDYEFMLQQRRGEVARAELNLKLEQGSQVIARQEYELLRDQVSEQERELVLREPYLASVKAACKASESLVHKAQLDVDRCTVRAPFNGVIQTKNTELGAQVSSASPLLTLTGTDVYWVEVLVKVDELKWIQIPLKNGEPGSQVRIYDEAAWGKGVFRSGRVSHLLPNVQSKGRLAKLLVVVDDPLALTPAHADQEKMLLDAYVRVRIQGHQVADAVTVSRAILHEDALHEDALWVMTDQDQLEIRAIEIAHRGREVVLVTGGIKAGERIVTTNIAAPIKGMALRLEDASAETAAKQNAGGKDHD
jgi:RND family efflux transporter MFP subunit